MQLLIDACCAYPGDPNRFRLIESAAPLPPIRWPSDAQHAEHVIFRFTGWMTDDYDMVSRLQGFPGHAVPP